MTAVKNGLRKTPDITVHIKPLEGFLFKNKEIKFGMSQREIENLLEKPEEFEVSNLSKGITESRDAADFFYWFQGDYIINYGIEQLRSLDVPLESGIRIFYKDIDILNDEEAVSKLSQYDTPTADDGKYMNFYELGICLGGYGRKKLFRGKIVTLFSRVDIKYFEILYKEGGEEISHKN
ncbi:MAG: hypothetical protein LBK13_03235 [Spirochaetales bacterium]|nr:hypothetical protein [Spirochaetales bacterium]